MSEGVVTSAAVRATTPLPSPMTVDGLVAIDNFQRNLIVSRPENLSGYQRLWWREAHGALVKAEQGGWSSAHPFLWAHSAEQRDIAHGLPVDNLGLAFHFPVGVDAYRELVSQPGLRAFVTVDKSTGWFTSVKLFHGRNGS
jgi:hypothetical protein